jgi:hypothetical protein
MTKPDGDGLDDLEAVRAVVAALEKFQAAEQQRILRWAQEKLGLIGASRSVQDEVSEPHAHAVTRHSAQPYSGSAGPDIKTFIQQKNPTSDTQFAAAVAYYHRFEAATKKEAIVANDLQDACRKVGRARLPKPAQTLVNAHSQGVLDRGNERGTYTLSTVGENLVAVALPAGDGGQRVGTRGKRATKRKKPTVRAKPDVKANKGAKTARR